MKNPAPKFYLRPQKVPEKAYPEFGLVFLAAFRCPGMIYKKIAEKYDTEAAGIAKKDTFKAHEIATEMRKK